MSEEQRALPCGGRGRTFGIVPGASPQPRITFGGWAATRRACAGCARAVTHGRRHHASGRHRARLTALVEATVARPVALRTDRQGHDRRARFPERHKSMVRCATARLAWIGAVEDYDGCRHMGALRSRVAANRRPSMQIRFSRGCDTRCARATNLIDLRLVRLAEGASETMRDDGEMCAVVLVGTVDVRVSGRGSPGCRRPQRRCVRFVGGRGVRPAGTVWVSGRSRMPSSRLPPPQSVEAADSARMIRPRRKRRVRSSGAGNWARTITHRAGTRRRGWTAHRWQSR